MKNFQKIMAGIVLAFALSGTALATSTIWGATHATPALSARVPVDTNSSSTPQYMDFNDVYGLLTGDVTVSSGAASVVKIGGVAVGTPTGTGNVVMSASSTMTGTTTMANIAASKRVYAGVAALSVSGSAIATDASLGNHFRVTPTHSTSTAMSAPSNPVDGQKITYELVQDSTGSGTISWNSVFAFGTSGAPTLTTTASKRDLVGFVYSSDETKWLYLGSQLNF